MLFIGVHGTNLYLLGCRGHLDFVYWGVGVQATVYWGAEGTALYGGAGHTPFIYWGGQDFTGIWGHRTLFFGVWGLRPLFIGVGALTCAYWGAEGTGLYLLGWGHQPVFIGVRGSGCSPGAFLGVLAQALRGVQGNEGISWGAQGMGQGSAGLYRGARIGGGLRRGCQVGCMAGTFLGWRTAADSGDIYRGAEQHKGGAAWSPPTALG